MATQRRRSETNELGHGSWVCRTKFRVQERGGLCRPIYPKLGQGNGISFDESERYLTSDLPGQQLATNVTKRARGGFAIITESTRSDSGEGSRAIIWRINKLG